MSMTTSRWMCRSTSWMRPSMVALDRPLDRVLDGDEAEVGRALRHGIEHRRDRAQGVQLGLGEVRLGQQRLLGEGRSRAEVGDGFRRRGHSWAG